MDDFNQCLVLGGTTTQGIRTRRQGDVVMFDAFLPCVQSYDTENVLRYFFRPGSHDTMRSSVVYSRYTFEMG